VPQQKPLLRGFAFCKAANLPKLDSLAKFKCQAGIGSTWPRSLFSDMRETISQIGVPVYGTKVPIFRFLEKISH
jgi:hypothetical protein